MNNVFRLVLLKHGFQKEKARLCAEIFTSTSIDGVYTHGERNPIEGKFGRAKTAYGMGRIKARLQQTSESWIASNVLVINLINLIGKASLYLIRVKQKVVVFINWLATLHEIHILPSQKLDG